jgi:hypothetical protein
MDPDAIDNSPSEFSWGRGLRPKGCERQSPDEGGMYGGRSPSTNPNIKRRYGHPGEQVRP